MRVFKTKVFRRFQRKENLSDDALCAAVFRAEQGLVDADLGGGLIKQRVARKGQGRSGGYRTIIAYRTAERAVFIFGFAKSRMANLSPDDETDLKQAGAVLLGLSAAAIETAIIEGELREIECDAEGQDED